MSSQASLFDKHGPSTEFIVRSMTNVPHGIHTWEAPHLCSAVREITDEDRLDMANYKSLTLQQHLARAGATEEYGEEGFTYLERVWHRPTCDVVCNSFPPPPAGLTSFWLAELAHVHLCHGKLPVSFHSLGHDYA